jgi:hypothetical protein
VCRVGCGFVGWERGWEGGRRGLLTQLYGVQGWFWAAVKAVGCSASVLRVVDALKAVDATLHEKYAPTEL